MLQLERIHDREVMSLIANQNIDEKEFLMRSNYGTVQASNLDYSATFANRMFKIAKKISRSECALSVIVIIFGICATLTSTYYNVIDVKGFEEFWSPCIQNISLSYKMLSM
jgi:CRISPR/Cas system-associated protein Cas5 (RAMP superfamily)